MGWRIYFVVTGLLVAYGWVSTIEHADDYGALTWVHFPIDALSLVGLFGYAFQRELLTAWVWRVLALVILALVPLDLSVMIQANAARPAPYGAGILSAAIAFHLALLAPTVFALLQYGRRLGRPRTDQEAPA
jgi:hypothetical protein